MKFKVSVCKSNLHTENMLLGQDGKIYKEELLGIELVKEAKPDFLVGFDSDGEDVFENDILCDGYSEYIAGLDLTMGAILFDNKGGKIPFKQFAGKLFLKNKGERE